MTAELYKIAIHESGHAVLAELLSMNPVSVTIEPTDKTYGHLRRRGRGFTALEKWRDLLVDCGGVAAEGIYGIEPPEWWEWPDWYDNTTDAALLWTSLRAHSEDEYQQQAWFELAFAQTRRILNNRPVWRSVEGLARRLMEKRNLDRAEAADVIDTALGRSKWKREQFEMALRYAVPPQTWIDSRGVN